MKEGICMEKLLKNCFRLYSIWQEDREMEWLRQMSLKGWHLISVCIFVYTFEKGEPMDIHYYGDFKSINKRDVAEYLDIFKDAGWKYICRQGNWFYFSSPADNKYKEVYSDNQSRLGKYRMLLLINVAVILPMLSNSLRIVSNRMANNENILMGALMFAIFVILLASIYSTIRLIVLVTKLRKSPKE